MKKGKEHGGIRGFAYWCLIFGYTILKLNVVADFLCFSANILVRWTGESVIFRSTTSAGIWHTKRRCWSPGMFPSSFFIPISNEEENRKIVGLRYAPDKRRTFQTCCRIALPFLLLSWSFFGGTVPNTNSESINSLLRFNGLECKLWNANDSSVLAELCWAAFQQRSPHCFVWMMTWALLLGRMC